MIKKLIQKTSKYIPPFISLLDQVKSNTSLVEDTSKRNKKVCLQSIIKSADFANLSQKGFFCVLGVDMDEKNVVVDIAKMPHLLIAGGIGQGKSVCINSIIVSMLYKYGPDELRFVMIDPKQVELCLYNNLPHLITDKVICQTKEAINTFDWLTKEAERREKLFVDCGVGCINDYNDIVDTNVTEKLPRIVVVVDEFAELVLHNKKQIENNIQKLCQNAHDVGIHLIFATQCVQADIITDVVKSNIPARIAFRVFCEAESMIVLDQPGAEKLVSAGTVLFKHSKNSSPVKLQGAFVSDSQVAQIVDFIKTNNKN